MRSFPFGNAALCILALAVVSGAWLAAHPTPRREATLTMWTFTKIHADPYAEAMPGFEAAHPGVKVDLQLVATSAVTSRLQAAFWAGVDVPDVVEVPIDFAPAFFRGPAEHIGFRDLTDRIHQAGLWGGMVRARFAPYTSRGHIYGLPHDVHPVMVAYRQDLFAQAGIDITKVETWDDFIRIGRRLTIPNKRYMVELRDSSTAMLELSMFQRGGGYFNPEGDCIFDNEAGVRTMLWYVPLVAGPHRIANDLGIGAILTHAMEDGYFLTLLCPDWRSKGIEQDMPRMAGKLKLMPLPAVTPGGLRTSTWGGTMLGITRHCKNPDLAWQLALHLYLDKHALGERFHATHILPALRAAWSQPQFRAPFPFWCNQPIGTLYTAAAPHVPFQYTSPFIVEAKSKLGDALVDCIGQYNANGDNGFEPFVRARLKRSADEVRELIRRNPY